MGSIDEAMKKIKIKLNHVEVYQKSDISTISVVCKNINYDVINKIFNIFKTNNIDFKQAFTSELSISFIVDDKYKQSFIELVVDEFNL